MSKVTGSIDRTSLSLSALTFGQGNGLSLFVGGLTPGRRSWRRTVVTSPYVAGEVETGAVLDQVHDSTFRFRARAADIGSLKTLVAELVTAVEQTTWALTFSVGATAWPAITCTRADTEEVFDVAHYRGLTATVFVYTTHNPNTSGPL